MTTTLSPETETEHTDTEARAHAENNERMRATSRENTEVEPTYTETVPENSAGVPASTEADPASTETDPASTGPVLAPSSAGTDETAEPVRAHTEIDARIDAGVPASTEADPAPSSASTEETSAEHRAALADLSKKARQLRYACEQLAAEGTSPKVEIVRTWLEGRGISTSRRYASRIVNDWRDENGYNTDAALPVMTAAALAEIEAQAAVLAPRPAPAAPVVDAEVIGDQDDEDDEDDEGDEDDTTPAALVVAEPTDAETKALAARVAAAEGRLVYQDRDALYDALSDKEIREQRKNAERRREIQREIDALEAEAELARTKKTVKAIQAEADAEAKDGRWHRRAVATRRRLSSPDASLADLYKQSIWSTRALVGVLVVCMVWSGANVQRNLVPSGDMSQLMYWLAYGLEAIISVPLIIIMLAATAASRRGTPVPSGRGLSTGATLAIEAGLLTLTLALNTAPHIAAGNSSKALEFAIAPVMVGAVVWLHARVSDHYAYLITHEDTRL